MSDFENPIGFNDCWMPPAKPKRTRGKASRYFSAGFPNSGTSGGNTSSTPPSGSTAGPKGGGRIAPSDKARLTRVINGAPEVMVKVTSPAKNDKSGNPIRVTRATEGQRVADHIDYISRNGDLELETSYGEVAHGKDDNRVLYNDWMKAHDRARDNGCASDRTRITTSLILSMPDHVNAQGLKDAVRAFAQEEFGGRHDYVMALHTNQTHPSEPKHPHVHLTVRTVGYDGSRLNIRKADLQRYRDRFASKLRQRGIEAESTPRHARGVTRKGERTSVYKMRQRGVEPYVDKSKRIQVERDMAANKGQLPTYAWDNAIMDKRRLVISAYSEAAEYLYTSKDPADRELASKTEIYLANLARVMTERRELSLKVLDTPREPQRAALERNEQGWRAHSVEKSLRGREQGQPTQNKERDKGRER